MCESIHHFLDTECMQLHFLWDGNFSTHASFSSTLSLSHIHMFLTSVSANLLANTTAVYKDIFRRGKSVNTFNHQRTDQSPHFSHSVGMCTVRCPFFPQSLQRHRPITCLDFHLALPLYYELNFSHF